MAARALVVDDDPPLRKLVATLLSRASLLVDTASDGEQALQKLDSSTYDVMLLDLMMPKLSGEKVIAELKERQHRPLVIVMTADLNVDPELFDSEVVHAIVRKPFDIHELTRIAAEAADVLKRSRNASEATEEPPPQS